MSNWKVSKEIIEIFPHPNAERLELGKVGSYQVVVQKGIHKNGDEVVFAPEKSILTGRLLEEYQKWLAGPDKNRVKAVRLRNELSCGIIIPNEIVEYTSQHPISEFTEGVDISELLGITKYEAPIPVHLSGQIEQMVDDTPFTSKHDCEQFGVYASNFIDGERVVVTEELHGSQLVAYVNLNTGYKFVTTKGFMGKSQCMKEDNNNAYWQAVNGNKIWELIEKSFRDVTNQVSGDEHAVQVFGELIPCQGGNWSYGFNGANIRVFDVRVNGRSVPYDSLEMWKSVWVPVIYDGVYSADDVRKLCKGKEQVTGKELHIREGVVVRPYIDRRATDGTRLMAKIINPNYKETGEELN